MFTTLRKLLQDNVSDLNEWLSEQKNCNKDLIEILKLHHKELEELKTFKSDATIAFTGLLGINSISGGINWDEIKIKGQEKCYFTREIIADDATNTKVLYVVNGTESKKVFFKEGNQTKEVKEINGKLYLFE